MCMVRVFIEQQLLICQRTHIINDVYEHMAMVSCTPLHCMYTCSTEQSHMYNPIQYYMSLVYKQQPLYTPSDVHNSYHILYVGICSSLQQQLHSLITIVHKGLMKSSLLVL